MRCALKLAKQTFPNQFGQCLRKFGKIINVKEAIFVDRLNLVLIRANRCSESFDTSTPTFCHNSLDILPGFFSTVTVVSRLTIRDDEEDLHFFRTLSQKIDRLLNSKPISIRSIGGQFRDPVVCRGDSFAIEECP